MEFIQQILQPTMLVIHLLIVIALVIIILLQPSEAGGLGMSGGGMSGFMTGRAQANFFTKTTAVLAFGFFATALFIAILTSRTYAGSEDILNRVQQEQQSESAIQAPAVPSEAPVDFEPTVGE